MKNNVITIRLSEKLKQRLIEECEDQYCQMSTLIRDIVQNYFDEMDYKKNNPKVIRLYINPNK